GVAGRAVPGGAVPAGRRRDTRRGGELWRRRPLGQRVCGVGVLGPDLPAPAGVPDPDRGAGADVRAAVRGGAGAARIRGDAGRPRRVGPAAGAAGPARAVVPLPPPIPRHAARRAGTVGTRTAAGSAAPRRRLVVARRAARGSAGAL